MINAKKRYMKKFRKNISFKQAFLEDLTLKKSLSKVIKNKIMIKGLKKPSPPSSNLFKTSRKDNELFSIPSLVLAEE